MFDGPEISFFSWQFLCISNHDIEEVFFLAFLMLFSKNGYMDFLLFNGEKMGIYSAWPREREGQYRAAISEHRCGRSDLFRRVKEEKGTLR